MYHIDGIDRRTPGDRRSGTDRRSISFPRQVERRTADERRVPVERREGYARVTKWDSVYLGVSLGDLIP
jgi:hypothetical protein